MLLFSKLLDTEFELTTVEVITFYVLFKPVGPYIGAAINYELWNYQSLKLSVHTNHNDIGVYKIQIKVVGFVELIRICVRVYMYLYPCLMMLYSMIIFCVLVRDTYFLTLFYIKIVIASKLTVPISHVYI